MSETFDIALFWTDQGASIRTARCLAGAGIASYPQLAAKSETELLRIPAFGRKSLNEVREILRAKGLHPMLSPRPVFPPTIANMKRWSRGREATALRETGLTLRECGEHFNVSPERLRQILLRHARHVKRYGDMSPYEVWLSRQQRTSA